MSGAISVVIPTHNRNIILNRSINSVLASIRDVDEIIIVDDGSSDETEVIVSSFDDARMIYIKQDHAGVSAARNTGMNAAKNNIVAFIDDDDEWHPKKLEVQRALMCRHPEAVASFTNFSVTDKAGSFHYSYLFRWGQPVQDWNELLGDRQNFKLDDTDIKFDYYFGEHYRNQMGDDYVLPSSLVINRANFKDKLMFRVGMQRNESWLFSSQVCRQGPVLYVDYDLACQHGDAINRLTDIPSIDVIESRIFVLENEFGKSQDILSSCKKEFISRLDRELDNLFKTALRLSPKRRSDVFAKNAYRGGRFYSFSKVPAPLISLYSFARRVVGYIVRAIGKD